MWEVKERDQGGREPLAAKNKTKGSKHFVRNETTDKKYTEYCILHQLEKQAALEFNSSPSLLR
jgi:hypothetical protein